MNGDGEANHGAELMINAAILGLGRYGQKLVDSVQGKSKKIRVTAGVTRTVERVRDYAERTGIHVGDDYAKVLNDPAIDAVILATPHSQHAEQVIQAARAGKHIFVEKPFTLTRDSAEAAVGAVREAGVVMALGHNRRFLSSMLELERRLESGAIGTVLHVEANMSSNAGTAYAPGMWRASRAESPAAGMAGSGIHMADAMLWHFGRIAEVHALSAQRVLRGELDDVASMLFRFENGMTGYLGALSATAPTWRFQVFGSAGSIELRDETRFEYRPMSGEPEVIEFSETDTQRAILEAFADAVSGRAPFPITLDQAVEGAAVFEAVARSAETGRTVSVP